MEFTTIDPLDKKVTFGTIPITGWAEGKKFSIGLDEDDWKTVSGTDGDVTRIRIRKDIGEISVFVSQGSATNSALSTQRQIDLSTGAGAFPLSVVDKGGITVITAKKAWIKKAPKVDESDNVEIREWVFSLAGLRGSYFVGGALA